MGGLLITQGVITAFDKAVLEKFSDGVWLEQTISDEVLTLEDCFSDLPVNSSR